MRVSMQDLRSERRRLEDRLLEGDTSGVRLQQLRDDLEKQVGNRGGGWAAGGQQGMGLGSRWATGEGAGQQAGKA